VADELIRQVTINCAERGILLLRVRDEINMTLEAYRTLYESSTAYGMRKALMAESGKSDLETKITQMSHEKENLETAVAELQAKMQGIENKYNEQKQAEELKHAEEISFLKKANHQIKVRFFRFFSHLQSA